MGRLHTLVVAVLAAATLVACGTSSDDTTTTDPLSTERVTESSDGDGDRAAFVNDVFAAMDAVEAELGAGQEFFEITANAQFTNVFVAVDDATAAIPYAFVDGELQPPAPTQGGAEGNTFTSDDVVFDPALVLSGVQADLPSSAVDAISVYGDGFGAIYVLAATSEVGGFLDIVVGPEGQVLSVDPI